MNRPKCFFKHTSPEIDLEELENLELLEDYELVVLPDSMTYEEFAQNYSEIWTISEDSEYSSDEYSSSGESLSDAEEFKSFLEPKLY